MKLYKGQCWQIWKDINSWEFNRGVAHKIWDPCLGNSREVGVYIISRKICVVRGWYFILFNAWVHHWCGESICERCSLGVQKIWNPYLENFKEVKWLRILYLLYLNFEWIVGSAFVGLWPKIWCHVRPRWPIQKVQRYLIQQALLNFISWKIG